MADENTRNGANPDNGDPLAGQVSADQNSAFLDDEELNEQLPDEFDADDRTALTAAHEGSNVQGVVTDTDSDRSSLFADDPLDSAQVQTNGESVTATTRVDELPFGDALYGEAPLDRGLNGSPDEALSAPSLLNGQSSDETIVDDQPALTAAHQGSRATSVPMDETAAFNPAAQADLFGDTPERASASAGPTSRTSNDALLGNPEADILGAPGSELPIGAENPAQNANEGGGRGSAAASETAGETAGGSTDTGAIDELPLGDGDADQGGSSPSASDGTTDEGPLLDEDLSGQAGSGSSGNDDGLGGSGDQSSSAGTGPAEDGPVEYVEETESAAGGDGGDSDGGGSGGNGVNPIIGTQNDDTLDGTDGRDIINAKSGDDVLFGDGGDDNILGGKGDDQIQGGTGDDTLKGGGGVDTLDGGAGADALDGGAGIDIADYSASASGVTVNLATGTGTGGDAQGDTLTKIENLAGSAFDDSLTGDGNANTLTGGAGDDTLTGGAGDDVFAFSDSDFNGTAWTDAIDGGTGDTDTIDLSNVTQGWTLEVDGAGLGAEATNLSNPSNYANGGEFSGTITFDDGSTAVFDNIERVDW